MYSRGAVADTGCGRRSITGGECCPVTWFTPCSYDPPLLLNARNGKDTLKNIVETGEFVLQTVLLKNVQSVHNLARNLPRDGQKLSMKHWMSESSKIDVPRLTIAVQWFEVGLTR